jgi:hypothetical protein
MRPEFKPSTRERARLDTNYILPKYTTPQTTFTEHLLPESGPIRPKSGKKLTFSLRIEEVKVRWYVNEYE